MQCPKCHAPMHTYNRSGVQIEQCSGCRGIFLDYGELESLTQLESQWVQQAPPPAPAPQAYPATPAPAWGAGHHGHGHRRRSFGHMLFSS
ncbi:zf-TFIIB domain-containing protein [Streptomyces sp. 796.1]|uniref:TFIIB-type zinc ribbon-containing protein n=1 Tax=Streptomyces sp. 796.1 TaxID=3163029 RepID=UPI0039C9722F